MNTNAFNLYLKKIFGTHIKKVIIFCLFSQRNRFKLFNFSDRAQNNQVNLNYWWESHNLGDTLSPVIVNYLLSLRGINPKIRVKGCRHLYAVGSVLTAGIQDCTVWGSGILNSTLTYRLEKRKFDIRAVRGPLTRTVLLDYGYKVPEVYGDPAIFMPDIYKPSSVTKKYHFGVIMHKDQIIEIPNGYDILSINICTDDYKDFIDKLNSVKIVISSSLHGIILAESYGIHAILLKPQKDIFKYFDWYYSTKRFDFPMANSIEEAIAIEPIGLPNNLLSLKESLKEVFPYDIFYG